MFTQNQKKFATGLGVGATVLGTVLLARHHKKTSHQVSKKEMLKKEAEAANHNRKRLHDYLNRHDKHKASGNVIPYGNGVYCNRKTGKCYVKDIAKNTEHVIADGWLNSAEKHLFGGK